MDLKQLEAFVSVADLGSFSKAAGKLYLAQPTVSAHVRSLEHELGTQLIVRTPKIAYPTKAGEQVYKYAMEMLSLRDGIFATCAGKRDDMAGAVRIAASTVPCQYLLPSLMADFRELHPNVTFELAGCDSAGVAEMVLAGKAELGVAGTVVKNPNLVYREICQDDLVVITPATAPYAGLESPVLDPEELLKMPCVVREPGSGTRIEAEGLLRAKGIDPAMLNIVAQMDNPDAIRNAVSQGLGVSIVSSLSAGDFEKLGAVRVFRLAGEPLRRKLLVVSHKYHPLSAVAERFLRFVSK